MEWLQLRLVGGGRLRFREDGPLVHMEVFDADDGRGLYKVYVHGARGKFLLGTLCPGQSGPELARRVSKSQLERCGCWPVTGGECVLSFRFKQNQDRTWQKEKRPERLVRDVVLREVLCNREMFLKHREDGFSLADIFDSNRAFPLPPLFCFARVCAVEGRTCVVFRFDQDGNPVIPV